MKVRVEREKCIGAGNCVAVAPDVFDLDEGIQGHRARAGVSRR